MDHTRARAGRAGHALSGARTRRQGVPRPRRRRRGGRGSSDRRASRRRRGVRLRWDACGAVAMAAADYEGAWRWRTRRLKLLNRVTDPDLRTITAETVLRVHRHLPVRPGARGRSPTRRADPLPYPHHRLHGTAILVEVDELLGDWQSIRDLKERARETVAANAGTPCLRNARSLLVCALAAACLGDPKAAHELERAADDLGLLGRQVLDAHGCDWPSFEATASAPASCWRESRPSRAGIRAVMARVSRRSPHGSTPSQPSGTAMQWSTRPRGSCRPARS
jgi:hypothetical protein